jgi:hypothetical protein
VISFRKDDLQMIKNTEAIRLTINSLLQNPTGDATAYMASRGRIIDDLEARYKTLMEKHKTFKYKTFRMKKDYLFLFEIPSESLDDIFYDVAILFYPEKPEVENDKTLTRYNIKLFSNSPAFVFTYAHVLNKSNLLVQLFKSKCGLKALTDAPKIKNPVETYGFEKSCYFACLFLKEKNLMSKHLLLQNMFLFDKLKLQLTVKTIEGKLFEINGVKEALKKKKKREKAAKVKAAVARKKSIPAKKKK